MKKQVIKIPEGDWTGESLWVRLRIVLAGLRQMERDRSPLLPVVASLADAMWDEYVTLQN